MEKRCLKGLISLIQWVRLPPAPPIMNGRFWKYLHLVGIVFFIGLWIVATLTGLVKSVTFVSHVSMIALVLAEISSWQASRVEQKEDKRNDN